MPPVPPSMSRSFSMRETWALRAIMSVGVAVMRSRYAAFASAVLPAADVRPGEWCEQDWRQAFWPADARQQRQRAVLFPGGRVSIGQHGGDDRGFRVRLARHLQDLDCGSDLVVLRQDGQQATEHLQIGRILGEGVVQQVDGCGTLPVWASRRARLIFAVIELGTPATCR